MAAGAQLGIQGFTIDDDFEAAPVGGDERKLFDLGFVRLEQFGRQTGGALSIVSDSAVGDFNGEQHNGLLIVR